MEREVSYEQIIEEVCGDCWLYTEKDLKNRQEVMECDNCREKLKEGVIDLRIVRRYSKIPEMRSNEITVWDWIRRPRRKFGEHGIKHIDYAGYAKCSGKIAR